LTRLLPNSAGAVFCHGSLPPNDEYLESREGKKSPSHKGFERIKTLGWDEYLDEYKVTFFDFVRIGVPFTIISALSGATPHLLFRLFFLFPVAF